MSDFLADCAERIIVLGIVHRRIINRFHKFILWLGIPLHRVQDTKPNEFCRIVSEFALEYRTTRERVIQQLEKKANHRERNKTRGKMITEVSYRACIFLFLLAENLSEGPPLIKHCYRSVNGHYGTRGNKLLFFFLPRVEPISFLAHRCINIPLSRFSSAILRILVVEGAG